MMKKLLLLAMPNRLFLKGSAKVIINFIIKKKFTINCLIFRLNKNILNEYLLKDLFYNLYVCFV